MWYHIKDDKLLLNIKAVPGSSKTEFAGIKDDRLRIRIAAAPEDGKANAELVTFLAKLLGCAKREITLQSGEKSRIKTISLPVSLQQELEKVIARLPGNKKQ